VSLPTTLGSTKTTSLSRAQLDQQSINTAEHGIHVRMVSMPSWELVHTFLAARFSGAERHRRRLAKVAQLEHTPPEKTP
jgi:ribose 5-phosphate isomerase RpiB